MRKYRVMGAALAAAALGAVLIPTAAADTDVVFTMSDERIQRASGLAADRDRGLYWTVNAGSESDRALAMRPDGTVEGTVRFGEFLTDPQAVYYIGSRLYIADIGDVDEERESIAVHRYTEPNPVGAQPEVIRTFELVYDDGQARDARAMLVGNSGQLFVITHAEEGEIWATNDAPTGSAPNRLTRVGDAPGWVTDALFMPDGRIVTRSYTSIEVIDQGSYEVIARAPAPFQDQGEAMSLSLDRSTLLLGSTGSNQDVLQVSVPSSMADVPDPVPSPPASPEPTPDPEPTPEPSEEEADEPVVNESVGAERTGTTVAIVAAAILAVGSGLVVYFSGGRRTVDEPLRRPQRAAVAPPPDPTPAPAAESWLPELDEPEPVVQLPVPPPLIAPESPIDPAAPPQQLISAGDDPFARPSAAQASVAESSGRQPQGTEAAGAPAQGSQSAVAPPPRTQPQETRPRRSITISEDQDRPVPARRAHERPRPAAAEYGFDEQGTWVRPTRTAEEAADDLRWLNRE